MEGIKNELLTEASACEMINHKCRAILETIIDHADEEDRKKYQNRLSEELMFIKISGMARYYLVLSEFISALKKDGEYLFCREKLGSSLVMYLLNAVNHDPVAYNIPAQTYYLSKNVNEELHIHYDIPSSISLHTAYTTMTAVLQNYGFSVNNGPDGYHGSDGPGTIFFYIHLDEAGNEDPTALRVNHYTTPLGDEEVILFSSSGIYDDTDIPLTLVLGRNKNLDLIHTFKERTGIDHSHLDISSAVLLLSGKDENNSALLRYFPLFGSALFRDTVLPVVRPDNLHEAALLMGLTNMATSMWDKKVEDVLKQGTLLADLPSTMDDVYLTFLRYGVPEDDALSAMHAIGSGRPIPKNILDQALTAGIPAWFVGLCRRAKYLHPKAFCLEIAYKALLFCSYFLAFPTDYLFIMAEQEREKQEQAGSSALQDDNTIFDVPEDEVELEEDTEKLESLMDFFTQLDKKVFDKVHKETIPRYNLDTEVAETISEDYFKLFMKTLMEYQGISQPDIKEALEHYFFGWSIC